MYVYTKEQISFKRKSIAKNRELITKERKSCVPHIQCFLADCSKWMGEFEICFSRKSLEHSQTQLGTVLFVAKQDSSVRLCSGRIHRVVDIQHDTRNSRVESNRLERSLLKYILSLQENDEISKKYCQYFSSFRLLDRKQHDTFCLSVSINNNTTLSRIPKHWMFRIGRGTRSIRALS